MNVVDHQDPRSQLVQTELPLSIMKSIGYTLRHALILKPPWADGGEIQFSIDGFEGSLRGLASGNLYTWERSV